MKRPDDIVSTLLWFQEDIPGGWHAEAFRNPEAHTESCRVYWGSHGCERPRGHDGDHWCDCCECADHPDEDEGCVAGPPYYGPETRFYGEDVPGWEQEPVKMQIEILE